MLDRCVEFGFQNNVIRLTEGSTWGGAQPPTPRLGAQIHTISVDFLLTVLASRKTSGS